MPADPALPEAVHNQSCLVIGGVYAGDVDEGMKVLQPLRELGTPLADISGPTPFAGVNSSFDPFFPMGTYQSYWKAQNLDSLPDEVVAIIAAKADSRPSPMTLAVMFHMGGAINRVGSADTAYGERTAQWMSSFDGNWEDPADNAANIAWVRGASTRSPAMARAARTPTSRARPTNRPARWPATRTEPTPPASGDQEAVRPGQLLPHQPEHPSGVGRRAMATSTAGSAPALRSARSGVGASQSTSPVRTSR